MGATAGTLTLGPSVGGMGELGRVGGTGPHLPGAGRPCGQLSTPGRCSYYAVMGAWRTVGLPMGLPTTCEKGWGVHSLGPLGGHTVSAAVAATEVFTPWRRTQLPHCTWAR